MLEAFVDLYRKLNTPPLQEGGELEFTCKLDAQMLTLLKEVASSGIEVEEIEQNGNYPTIEDVIANNQTANILLKIPTNGDYNIFWNIDDLLDRSVDLVHGKALDEFYVCSDNYWSVEKTITKVRKEYTNLNLYCELVKGLEKLASYHDKKQNGINHELVFINNDESINSRPVVLRPQITLELLKLDIIDISLVSDLTSRNSNTQANINRERAIFKVSIVEFIETVSINHNTDNFKYFVTHWNAFITLFDNNFETYMSGFAFHKAKKEVADIELQVAEQYSKVLGDIAGKLFGLPVSFAALLGFFSDKATVMSDIVIIISIIAASWLMSRLVSNQRSQLERITHAKEISFGSIQGKSTQYPEELKNEIQNAKKAIDSNAGKLTRDLAYLSTVIWAPLSIGLSILLCRHRDALAFLWAMIKGLLN